MLLAGNQNSTPVCCSQKTKTLLKTSWFGNMQRFEINIDLLRHNWKRFEPISRCAQIARSVGQFQKLNSAAAVHAIKINNVTLRLNGFADASCLTQASRSFPCPEDHRWLNGYWLSPVLGGRNLHRFTPLDTAFGCLLFASRGVMSQRVRIGWLMIHACFV